MTKLKELKHKMLCSQKKAIDAYDDYIAYGDFAKDYVVARNEALADRDAYRDALKEVENEIL